MTQDDLDTLLEQLSDQASSVHADLRRRQQQYIANHNEQTDTFAETLGLAFALSRIMRSAGVLLIEHFAVPPGPPSWGAMLDIITAATDGHRVAREVCELARERVQH